MNNFPKITQTTTSLETRDGIRLDMEVYRPEDGQKYPILLMRQPYGRQIASTIVYAHPLWYAAHGYIVVIQDVRGRGSSTGEFRLFAHEREDGEDTISWLSQLEGSTGEVGMYGFSYQGMTQLYAAATKPPGLKTICPAMIAYNLYQDWAFENGAFCLQSNLGWALQLASETARLKGDNAAFVKLFAAAHNLPLADAVPIVPEILQELAPDSFYHDWLTYPENHPYWRSLSPENFIEQLDLPMLHIGGWFDPYLRGTLNLYKAMSKRSQYLQKLIIAPWSHISWSRTVGSQNYGKDAISLIDIIQIKWFNYFLKGQSSEILQEPPISLFEMGSNQWKHLHKWPDPTSKSYYLTSTGLANVQESDGHLVETLSPDPQQDVLVHDPWRSVPSLGGHAAFPGGSFERSSLDNRGDILTYTTAPLVEDLSLLGAILFEGYCVADAASFDVCATLSQVHPDGRVYNFTQGYSRCDDPKLPLRISLQCTCIKIPWGHRLRLSLSGACFPAYSVNSGTLKSPKETKLIDFKIITIKIQSQGKNASRIIVPVG